MNRKILNDMNIMKVIRKNKILPYGMYLAILLVTGTNSNTFENH